MFSVKKKIKTTSDEKIEQLIAILYPPMQLEEENGVKFHIDYSVDANLDAVISDLEDGHNDKVAQDTLKDVSNRLFKVRKLLEAYRELDKNAQYIIVDNMKNDEEIRHAE
jgi:ATP phosphoribosyltransferase